MPKYDYTIEFEAEDDNEAQDLIWNERYGASNSFGDIHHEALKRDGETIRAY